MKEHLLDKKISYKKIDDNSSRYEIYCLVDEKGLFHSDEYPSLIIFSLLSEIECRYYFSHGILYHPYHPAIEARVNGKKDQLSYHQKKTLISSKPLFGLEWLYHESKSYHAFLFWLLVETVSNSPRHRDSGPALIIWHETGEIKKEEWWLEGEIIDHEII